MSTGLQTVRQKIRHLLAGGSAAGPALQQGPRLGGAQEQPGALRPVESLMPGHGDEGRTQFRKGHRQAACGLRCVQNQGNPPCPAQSRHTLHRQDITKNVGDMVADHTGYALELAAEGLHQFPRLEQRAGRHAYVCSQCMQRPGDGIVLITGDKHGIARLDQGFDGNIEGVGRIEGEDHLLRSLYLKKLRSGLPAGEGRVRRQHGGRVPAPARRGHMAHGIRSRPRHRGRLLQRGRGIVQIDHSSTSL